MEIFSEAFSGSALDGRGGPQRIFNIFMPMQCLGQCRRPPFTCVAPAMQQSL
jgi:hypothetical protein